MPSAAKLLPMESAPSSAQLKPTSTAAESAVRGIQSTEQAAAVEEKEDMPVLLKEAQVGVA